MIKFAVKVGLASAAVYYVNEQGLWKRSDESVKTYNKLKESVQPYANELKKQIPYELPEIPQTGNVITLAKQGWNYGVLASFKLLINLPQTVGDWSSQGVDSLMANPDVKNFIDSLSNSSSVEKK